MAKTDLLTTMAYYVAKKLHLRPNDILNCWGVSELVVTFGIYRNEDYEREFYKREEYNKSAKKKIPQIPRYAVKFYTRDELGGEVSG